MFNLFKRLFSMEELGPSSSTTDDLNRVVESANYTAMSQQSTLQQGLYNQAKDLHSVLGQYKPPKPISLNGQIFLETVEAMMLLPAGWTHSRAGTIPKGANKGYVHFVNRQRDFFDPSECTVCSCSQCVQEMARAELADDTVTQPSYTRSATPIDPTILHGSFNGAE